jgi:LemA protein
MIPVYAILAVVALVIIWVIGMYNALIRTRLHVKESWSAIDTELKRRYDLIPNLVETAKGYMAHERETLEAVISARNAAMAGLKAAAAAPGGADAMKQLAGAEGALSGALGRLSVVVERYPDLKANQNMMQLSEELTSTENKVAFSRQAFNDTVTAYNTYKQTFPPVVVAGLVGHGQDASLLVFEDSDKIKEAPKVAF